jgi:hypothetical protein
MGVGAKRATLKGIDSGFNTRSIFIVKISSTGAVFAHRAAIFVA